MKKKAPGKAAGPAKKPAGRKPAAVELVSQREYARRRGVSHVAVIKAIQAGRISTQGGLIDPAKADREWDANTDQSKPLNSVTGAPKHRRGPGPSQPMEHRDREPASEAEAPAPGGATVAQSYSASRAVRERYLAGLAKVEYEQKVGSLVATDEVRIATFNAAREARNQLLALPDRLALILVGRAAREIHGLLTQEVRRICEDIARATRIETAVEPAPARGGK